MFNFLKSPTYRAEWSLVRNSPLFDPNLQNLDLRALRRELKQLLITYGGGEPIKIFDILREKGLGYLLPIKILETVHLLLQVADYDKTQAGISSLVAETTRVLNETTQAEEEEKIHRKIKKLGRIQQEMKESQQDAGGEGQSKRDTYIRRMSLQSQKDLGSCVTTATSIGGSTQSLPTYLRNQLVKPYASFLLKYVSFMGSYRVRSGNEIHQMWSQLNLLKVLLKVTENLGGVLEVFEKQMKKEVIVVVQIFSWNISRIYDQIWAIMKEKLSIVQMQYAAYLRQPYDWVQMYKRLAEMVECMELKLFKEAIEELLLLNDQILALYKTPKITRELACIGCKPPETLDRSNKSILLLYEVLRIEKEKRDDYQRSLKKRLSYDPQYTIPRQETPLQATLPTKNTNPTNNTSRLSQQIDIKPMAVKTSETKRIESKPNQSQHFERKPVERKPIESQHIERKHIQSKNIESKHIERKPIQTKPIQTKLIQTKPSQTNPVFTQTKNTLPARKDITQDVVNPLKQSSYGTGITTPQHIETRPRTQIQETRQVPVYDPMVRQVPREHVNGIKQIIHENGVKYILHEGANRQPQDSRIRYTPQDFAGRYIPQQSTSIKYNHMENGVRQQDNNTLRSTPQQSFIKYSQPQDNVSRLLVPKSEKPGKISLREVRVTKPVKY